MAKNWIYQRNRIPRDEMFPPSKFTFFHPSLFRTPISKIQISVSFFFFSSRTQHFPTSKLFSLRKKVSNFYKKTRVNFQVWRRTRRGGGHPVKTEAAVFSSILQWPAGRGWYIFLRGPVSPCKPNKEAGTSVGHTRRRDRTTALDAVFHLLARRTFSFSNGRYNGQ